MSDYPVPPPRGPRGAPVAVALHGFAQTGACWGPLASRLAVDHRLLTPDCPGHGAATDRGGLDCPGAAGALATAVSTALRSDTEAADGADEAPGGAAPAWIGYSMGARLALHVALGIPSAVGRLVLVSGTAGVEDHDERAARREVDERRARRLEEVGVQQFVREWLAMDMFAGLRPWARYEAERSANTAAGLAASLRHAGTGSMQPVWSDLHRIGVPVLCLAGGRDTRFVSTARRLASSIGTTATVHVVHDAGHAPHLERPGATADAVGRFLAEA